MKKFIAAVVAVFVTFSASQGNAETCGFNAKDFEAGDRVSALGTDPKVIVGEDNKVRFFTAPDMKFTTNVDMSAYVVKVTGLFREIKNNTLRKITLGDEVLQFEQDHYYAWVKDGGKQKRYSGLGFYKHREPNEYQIKFKDGIARFFINEEYFGSVEVTGPIHTLSISGLTEKDKVFSIKLEGCS